MNIYQIHRILHIDFTEWMDVYWGLRALGVKPPARVVDVGGGCCLLARFLSRLGYRASCCDVDTSCGAAYCDAARGDLPDADAYVAVHVLEHLPWPRGVYNFATRTYPRPVVAVVPGHFSEDETHVVNHFTHHVHGPRYVVQIDGRPQRLATVYQLAAVFEAAGYRVRVEPDVHSFAYPWDVDWVLMAGVGRFGSHLPLVVRLARRLLRAAVSAVSHRVVWRLHRLRQRYLNRIACMGSHKSLQAL